MYINKQEDAFLKRFLAGSGHSILDMGCGTGRFLNYATSGADISEEMIKIAAKKNSEKELTVCDAEKTPFSDQSFNHIFCMHMFMHLTKEKSIKILDEASRILKSGGYFIFDFPSKKRRNLLGRHKEGWHGANSFNISDIKHISSLNWEVRLFSGIMFIPIHRVPKKVRNLLIPIDSLLCNSPLKEYSSYLIVVLKKK